jgi:L-ascorbate metabolism protein UlaG (beta-lactamase superfamily)
MGVGLTITSVPARHFSGRTPFDRFTTLWGAYVLAGPKHRVFFGADSGYWEGFGEIAEAYGPFDVTMLEIGASHPMWKDIHMGPEGAVQAMKDMGDRAGLFMPIHWGLFNLALHGWRQPMERLREIKTGLRVWSPTPGVPTEVEGAMETGWWERRQ